MKSAWRDQDAACRAAVAGRLHQFNGKFEIPTFE
jgi:hypothetical protein